MTELTAHTRALGGEILGYTVRDPKAEYQIKDGRLRRHKILEAGYIFRMRDAAGVEHDCIYWNSRKWAGMRYPLDSIDLDGTTDFERRSGKVVSGRHKVGRWGVQDGTGGPIAFSPTPFDVVIKPGKSLQVVFNVHSQKNLFVGTFPLDATLSIPSGGIIRLNPNYPTFETFTQVSGDYVLEITNTKAIPVNIYVHLTWDS